MEITVNQGHIDAGIPSDKSHCPVALAMASAGLVCPEVHASRLEYVSGAYSNYPAHIHHPTPLEVVDFIEAFDAGNDVSPFDFNLI